jgi:hypothetical protein
MTIISELGTSQLCWGIYAFAVFVVCFAVVWSALAVGSDADEIAGEDG